MQRQLYTGHQGIGFTLLFHHQTGGLVHNHQIFVLIHDLGRAARLQIQRAVGFGKAKLFIFQIQRDLIAVQHAGAERLLFAVELDLVFAQGFV